MPQFDAGSIVDPLQIKLDPYVPGFGWRTIPEPSDQQVGQYLSGLKKLMAESRAKLAEHGEVDVTDQEQVAVAMEDLEPADFVKVADEYAGLYADLCSGPPGSDPVVTKADLLSVPLRRRNKLYQWLQGEVLNPEAVPGDGSEQVTTLPPAAAG